MNVVILKHVAFEGPGLLARWLDERRHRVEVVDLWKGDSLPPSQEIDMLISMGGPMSVHDTDRHRWILPEQELIRELHDAGRSVLGICLGAQQIARALGGEVLPMSQRVIGWYPVRRIPGSDRLPGFEFPSEFSVLHWHGEMVSCPTARVLLASDLCPVEAFHYAGSRTIGLQFHLEMDTPGLESIIEGAREEAARPEESCVSGPEALRQGAYEHAPGCYAVLDRCMSFLTSTDRLLIL